jgi:sRNA-binding carbon storage regulator CsrA
MDSSNKSNPERSYLSVGRKVGESLEIATSDGLIFVKVTSRRGGTISLGLSLPRKNKVTRRGGVREESSCEPV